MTKTLGLTGSIGMGKSTAAKMFRDEGFPVWNADQAVHDLYTTDQNVINDIAVFVPKARTNDGLDRKLLREAIKNDASLLKKIENVVHPAVQKHRAEFIEKHRKASLVILEIPLIFELGIADDFDAIVVVSTDADIQRSRVLERGTMSEQDFEFILSKQVPDAVKREKADFIIPSSNLEVARNSVLEVIASLVPDHRI